MRSPNSSDDGGTPVAAATSSVRKLIFCQGVPRSGSTWALNMVISIINEVRPDLRVTTCYADTVQDVASHNARNYDVMVVKSHATQESLLSFIKLHCAPVIVSVRDPRDCVASYLEVFRGEFAAREREVQESFAAAAELASNADAYVIKYESGSIENPQTLLEISEYLGLRITGEQALKLLTSLAPSAVKAKIARLVDAGKIDPDNRCSVDPHTHWTPRHVGDGRIGKYEEILTAEQISSINCWSRTHCKIFGYEIFEPQSAPTENDAALRIRALSQDGRAQELMDRLKKRGLALVGLAEYCGSEEHLGLQEVPEWRVWVDKETTPDQRRIEDCLERSTITDLAILHVGIGNSSLAKRFADQAREIFGTTIYQPESEFAKRLCLPKYQTSLMNKYSQAMGRLDRRFDLIVDNNPASFACCVFHFCRMMIAYFDLLSDRGEIVTAQPGLGWVISGGDPNWSLGWDEWVVLAKVLGLHAYAIDEFVYTMSRSVGGSALGRMPIRRDETAGNLEARAREVGDNPLGGSRRARMSLAIGFTTIDRPQVAQRFVRSVRRHFPDIPIYVAEQSPETAPMTAFYAEQNVRVIRMGYDAGLSASRNRLMSEIEEDYVWLCDDDVVFYGGTSFAEAVTILDACPEIAVVGGRMFDLAGDTLQAWHWEMFLNYDERNRILTVLPIYHVKPLVRRVGEIRFYLCDMVHNFAIFRRSIFDATIKWDELLKVNGEHEDFYLTLKRNSDCRPAYLPEMAVFHRPTDVTETSYTVLRSRTEFWRHFMVKWNLDQYLEIGAGVCDIDHPGVVVTPVQAGPRFYSDIVPVPVRRRTETDQLEGAQGERQIALGGAASIELGAIPHDSAADGVARALAASGGGGTTGLTERREPFDPSQWRVFCRYDPVWVGDSDFIVWCKWAPSPTPSRDGSSQLEIRTRWFSPDDRVLVWEAGHATIQLPTDQNWLPLLFEVPLVPRGTAFLRFEIIADSVRGPVPLCSGFLLPSHEEQGERPGGQNALALSTVFEDFFGSSHSLGDTSPQALDLPVVTLSAERIGGADAALLLLRLDPSSDLDAVYFKNWPGAGKALLGARIPELAGDAPRALAIPDIAPARSDAAILVYDHSGRAAAGRIEVLSETQKGAGTAGAIERPAKRPAKLAREKPPISVVVTSCARQDLLDRTLDSFFRFNTAPITQFLVVEDGPGEVNAPLMAKYRERGITWLATENRVGQIGAVDHAYSHVDSPYIFHLEDDWEFFRGGFVEKSLMLLEALPDCLQVWLRALDDTNGHPIAPELTIIKGVPFHKLQSGFQRIWHGFAFNPGLRRTADYARLGNYGWFAASEGCLSEIYKQLGFYAAILADRGGKGYVRHIGWGRHVVELTRPGEGHDRTAGHSL